MNRTRMKRALSAIAHSLGLTRAATRVGDSWSVRHGARFPEFQRKREPSFLILIYHRVNDDRRRFSISAVPVARFEEQMAYLARHFRVVSLHEILDRIGSRLPMPRRCVAVTFDDGYKDNYLHAYPILRKYRIPATVFVTAGCVETGSLLWFDRVLGAFETSASRTLDVPGLGKKLNLESPGQRFAAAVSTLEYLKGLPESGRLRSVEEVLRSLGVRENGDRPNHLLNWSEIREMADGGITIGSHSMSHPILSKTPPDRAIEEVCRSKALIESRTGRPVRLFAYPNGRESDFTPQTVGMIRSAGYEAALTTLSGLNFQSEDPYRWKRIRSWAQDLPSFALSLAYYRMVLNP